MDESSVWLLLVGLGNRGVPAGELCGANGLNSLTVGAMVGSALYGCTEELMLLVRLCNLFPKPLGR